MELLTLYPDGTLLQAALIHHHKKNTTIKQLSSLSLQDLHVKPFDILNTEIISGLDPTQVFVRDLELKLSSKRAILSALPFQMESLLPFSQDQVITLPLITKTKEGSSVSLFAADHAAIEHHLAVLKGCSLEPDQISCAPKAILRLAQATHPECSSLLFFHLGHDKSFYALSLHGQLQIAQPFRWTLSHFLEAFKKDCPEEETSPLELNLLELDSALYPELSAVALQFQRDLDRVITFSQKKQASSTVFLTGHLSEYFNLKLFVKHAFGPSFTFLAPQWEGEETATAETYAIPLGLSLEYFSQDNASLQFRQGPFTHPQTFKKKAKLLGTTLLSAVLLIGCLWGAETLYLNQKRSELLKTFKCTSGLEKEEDLIAGMDRWEKMLAEKKRMFPYDLTAPKASDVLHWLSTHPKLSSKDLKEKIEIKGFDYSLVKYPKLPNEQTPYLAKVELEFTSSSPKFAQEFREALLKDSDLVNTKAEMTWNVQQNLYRTSFFLNHQGIE